MSNMLLWSWFIFAVVVAANRRLRAERVTARAPGTWMGITIQALAFSLIWMVHTGVVFGIAFPLLVQSVAVVWLTNGLGIASVALGMLAIVVLGRNWSVAAQVSEGHRLVREGPYRYVRHPIYTAMFGMLVATGLSIGNSLSLLAAALVFVVGTYIRVYFEERLLSRQFGTAFERYAAEVPAFIPFFPTSRSAREAAAPEGRGE